MWLTLAVTLKSAQIAGEMLTDTGASGGERGLSEADQLNRFSVHLHVKWPGCDTAREEPAGENEERFPGQLCHC